jgi:DNA transposition AAA+ family ATPase
MDRWEETRNVFALAAPQPTKDFLDVRKACMTALRGGMAYVLDGPPGTQKTFSLLSVKHEINQLADGSRAIRVYARIDHSPQSFLQECCNEAGISSRGSMDQLIRKLRFFLSGPRILFMVDEAQHLDHKGLEILRQLLDEANFGVILAGSHDLSQRLSHWQMEQWRSRVRKTLYLNGPSHAEAREILRAELGELTDADCDETITACQATASRSDAVSRKPVTFTYISARDLFATIERVREVMPIQSCPIQKSTQKADAA